MSWSICDMCGQPHSVSWSNKTGEGMQCEARTDRERPIYTAGGRTMIETCEKWVPRVRVAGE